MSWARILIVPAAAVTAALILSGIAGAGKIVVEPGESIQAAVDAASPGDKVVVKRGVYHESVLITTDDLKLVGKRARIEPPASPVPSPCADPDHPDETIGLCIFGEFFLSEFAEDVKIAGFKVTGFDSAIAAVGAKDARIKRNRTFDNHVLGIVAAESHGTRIVGNAARDDGFYGIFALLSTGTRIVENRTTGNSEAGIYVGDSPDADAVVKENRTSGNLFGIFVRNAQNGEVEDNRVAHNCLGILVLAGAPGPAGAFDIEDNRIAHNTRFCPGMYGGPSFSGVGIALVGAHDVVVEDNDIVGNRPSRPPDVPTGGVVVATDPDIGVEPTGNRIEDNDLRRNDPDLFWDLTGFGNGFEDNDCATSVPDGLCENG
jgi:parallel beta-helix repeat protein